MAGVKLVSQASKLKALYRVRESQMTYLLTQGSKCANASKNKDKPPAKKSAKVDKDIIKLSRSDDEGFIARLVEKKQASNLTTVTVMDGKCKVQSLREQLVEAHQKIGELKEELQEYKFEKEVQQHLKELGVGLNSAGSVLTSALTAPSTLPQSVPATTNATHPTAPTDIMNQQFHYALQNYLEANNLTIVDNWDVDVGPSELVFDPTHPFNQPNSTGNNIDGLNLG
ncbi:hypothetical protein FRC11_000646 [Ceratobasidium sp. 423]|nr:hypothetical protein FRC11_000646 [Ceratobasidium sp. 423]